VLGDNHPTVASTLESMQLVESAKYCAENPMSPASILMNGAETVCNAAEPTNMASMLGFDSSKLDPQQWFPNPCAPSAYTNENDYTRENASLRKRRGLPNTPEGGKGHGDGYENSGSGSSSSGSSSSDERESEEFEAITNQVSI
jgi:hypothetical protein